MPCIPCQRKKTNIMENKIKELASAGFDTNRIAAMLMVPKHKVEEALAPKKEPVVIKKSKSKKTKIEDETL